VPGARNRERFGVERAERVEIDETVVERRDQDVRGAVGLPHQSAVVAGRVDDDELVRRDERVQRFRERLRRCGMALRARTEVALVEADVRGQFEFAGDALRPCAPVLDIVAEAALPAVEVDGGHALAALEKRHGDVHRDGRFAGAALLVGDCNHARRTY
jgi:hypothetical protein